MAVAAGCIGTKPLLCTEEQAKTPCQLGTFWRKEVVYAPDPVHGGAPNPGLAGRLYLFGPENGSPPLAGDGSLVVDLFDDSGIAAGAPSKRLERWCIDKDTLKRLMRHDIIGDGYTLFLPWGTFKPDIRLVHLLVCYQPQKGTPLYTTSQPIILHPGGGPPVQVTSRTVVPALNGAAPAAAPNRNPAVTQASNAAPPAAPERVTRWPDPAAGSPLNTPRVSAPDVQRFVIPR
jgi:hypothetical protein